MKSFNGSRLAAGALLLVFVLVLAVTLVPAAAQEAAKEPAYRHFPGGVRGSGAVPGAWR